MAGRSKTRPGGQAPVARDGEMFMWAGLYRPHFEHVLDTLWVYQQYWPQALKAIGLVAIESVASDYSRNGLA